MNSKAQRKVQVVYYLSRGGQLEQPHLLELTVSSSQGVTLRDVKQQLAMMRGGGIASSFSWSYKRSYKNGYVWQDIGDHDLVFPAHGCEYILKGSEIVVAPALEADLHEDGRGGDDLTTPPNYRKEAHRRAKSCSVQTDTALESQFRSSCNVSATLLQDGADETARPKLLLIGNGTDLTKTISGGNNNLATQTVARVVEDSAWKQGGGPQHLHKSRSKRNRHSTDFDHNSNDTSTTSHSSLSSSSSNNLTVVSNQPPREYKMIARDDIHAGAADGTTPFCSARYDFSSIKGEVDPDQTPVSSHGRGADYHLQGYETPVSGPLGNMMNSSSNIRPKTKHPFTSSGLLHLVSCAGVGLDIKADMIPLSLCLCSGNNNESNKRSGRTSQADDNRSSMSDTMSDRQVNTDKSSSNSKNRPWYKSYKRSFLKAPTTASSSCLQNAENSAQEEIQIDCPPDSSSSEVSRELVEDSSESCSQTTTTTALRLKLGSARSTLPTRYSPSCYRAKQQQQQQQQASNGERSGDNNNNNQRTATLWERLAASKREYDSMDRDEERKQRSEEFARDGWDLHGNAVDTSPPFNDPC